MLLEGQKWKHLVVTADDPSRRIDDNGLIEDGFAAANEHAAGHQPYCIAHCNLLKHPLDCRGIIGHMLDERAEGGKLAEQDHVRRRMNADGRLDQPAHRTDVREVEIDRHLDAGNHEGPGALRRKVRPLRTGRVRVIGPCPRRADRPAHHIPSCVHIRCLPSCDGQADVTSHRATTNALAR